MFRQEKLSTFIFGLYLLTDLVFIYLAFFLPYFIRWNFLGPAIYPLFPPRHLNGMFFPSFDQYSKLYISWGLITISFLFNQSLYQTNRLFSVFRETLSVLKAVISSTLIIGLIVFFIKAIHISRLVFLGNFILLCFFLSFWRALKKLILKRFILRGYNNFNILVVGTGNTACEFVKEIADNPAYGFKIAGFLDENKEKGSMVSGFKVLGGLGDFEKAIRQYFIDDVLITTAQNSKEIADLIRRGKELNVSMRVIPDPFELALDVINVYRIGHLPIFDYSVKQFHGANLIDKRFMDIMLSTLALVLFLPPALIIAIAIKIYDRGPVFYVSKRYGRKGAPFNFYKFRSMVIGAEERIGLLKSENEKDGPIFKIKDDPRITKIGKLLRKYSLDEFPQFWNVFKGDMSIVGPRPLPIGQIEKDDLDQLKRLEIKPGITGLWQISGRSDASFSNLLRWDIWYINNWSLWLDLTIILKSIPVVIKGKGAY